MQPMYPGHLLIAIVAATFAASPLPLLLQRYGRGFAALATSQRGPSQRDL